jgi:hypothetical protein
MTPLREKLIHTLQDHLGTSFDTDDAADGALTAHAALAVTAWVLESFGLPAPQMRVEALTAAHKRKEREWDFDDDAEWPLPAADYAELIEEVLGIDLDALTPGRWRPAPARFGAPTTDLVIGCIRAHRDFQGNDPDTWQIQLRAGGPIDGDPQAELDRFIAFWSYTRSSTSPWVELNRGEAVDRIAWLQRNSLLWSTYPFRDTGESAARSRAEDFLYCFPKATRYFSNTRRPGGYSFCITPFTLDTGVIAFSERLAGMWWHAEAD